MKAGIMTEQLINNKETDLDNDERDTGVLDAVSVVSVKKKKVSVLFCILSVTIEKCWVIVIELSKVWVIWLF